MRRRLDSSGAGKSTDEPHSPHEGGIHVLTQVRGEHRESVVALHPLEQVADLHVGVAVVRVVDGRPAAEQRVGLVEEEHRAGGLGSIEHPRQVLLRVADVLRHDRRQVDDVQVQPEAPGHQPGRHRLPGARWPGEERGGAAGWRQPREAPLLADPVRQLDLGDQRVQQLEPVQREHQLVPVPIDDHAAGRAVEPRPGRRPGGIEDVVVGGEGGGAGSPVRRVVGARRHPPDRFRGKAKARREAGQRLLGHPSAERGAP